MRLRLAGFDFDRIARKVGYASRSSAWKAFERAMKRREQPVTKGSSGRENAVNLELARLDELQRSIWKSAMRGDLAALDRVLKISDRREKLLHRYHGGQGAAPARDGKGGPAGGVVVEPDVLDKLRERRANGNA